MKSNHNSFQLLNWIHLNIKFVIRFNSYGIQFTALQQKRHKLAHVIILPEDNLKVKKTVVPRRRLYSRSQMMYLLCSEIQNIELFSTLTNISILH